MHRIEVHLVLGGMLLGVEYEMDLAEVQNKVQEVMAAETKGFLVLDCGDTGWRCVPARSIEYISIVPVP